jgi:Skp family chaperone for outer membrane proteins
MNISICCALFLAVITSTLSFSRAQESGNSKKIGVIDMRRILDESQAAQHIQKQVERERETLKQEFGNLEQQLKRQKQKLIQEQGQLSQQAFQKKRAQFQRKLEETRTQARTKRQKLKQAINKAMNVLRENVKEVVAKLGESGGYDLIISRQGAIYAADKHDITDMVLKRLNGKTTQIDLDYSVE